MDENIQKQKHQQRYIKEKSVQQQYIKKAAQCYFKQMKSYTNNRDPTKYDLDFKTLKHFYRQLKDPYTGHWMKEIPKKFHQEKERQKKESDLKSLQ